MKTLLAFLVFAGGIASHAADLQREVRSMDLPKYPPLAYQARIQGTVRLNVAVDAQGQVTKATVLSGHGLLKAAAAANVKTWRFAPLPGGSPSETTVNYVFKIEGKETPYVEASKQRSRISLDLPGTIEISAPPMTAVYESTDSKQLSSAKPSVALSQSE